ncbi:MAG: lactate utilization protein [Akkermansia sp.]
MSKSEIDEGEMSLAKCAKHLENYGFRTIIVSTNRDAADVIRQLVVEWAPMSVSYGDSMTLRATGVLEELKANPKITFYDGFDPALTREAKMENRRQGMLTDLFLTGVNAVSMRGTLHWVDMVGNRVAPIAFGPKRVILLVGKNKLTPTPELAMARIKQIAPLNAKRHEGFKTPCVYTGQCGDCNSPDRLCNIFVTMARCFPKGRITVILTEESGGL